MTLLCSNMKLIRFLELAEFLQPSLNGNQQLEVLFRGAFAQTYAQLPILEEKIMTVESFLVVPKEATMLSFGCLNPFKN